MSDTTTSKGQALTPAIGGRPKHLLDKRKAEKQMNTEIDDSIVRDAMRYRWLRDQAHPDSEDSGIAVSESDFNDWGNKFTRYYSGEELDAAIDAARAADSVQEDAARLEIGKTKGGVSPRQGVAYAALPEPLEIDWPELHSQALGCGVEDRDLHNRYECAEYGWQDGVDKCAERVPEQIFDADQMHAFADATCALRPSNGQAPAGAGEPTEQQILEAAFAPAQPGAEPAPSATAHVGDSLFESWFSEYNPAHRGTKQQMRDAYAAGMGDPKAQPSPTPQASHGQAPSHVLHLVQDAFAEVAMAYPKAFALHKVGIADTAVRGALAGHTPQADSQPAPALWLSPEQFANFMDTDKAPFGKYIPARKTSADKFTMPLFAAIAQAQPVAEPAGAVSEMVKFTDQSTANPIEKARRYLAHVANKKPNNPYLFDDGYPRESIADDAAAALSVLEQLAASHGQAPAQPDPAYSEACNLATALFKKHFAHLPDYASGQVVWGLFDSTEGVILQIDNMVSGLVQPPTTAFSEEEL